MVNKLPKDNLAEALKPSNPSTKDSREQKDPLYNDAILIDGVNGFVQRTTERQFQLDFSAFVVLVRSSYDAQVTFDRGFKKYVSFGMYQYYCFILLWRRLLYVISQRGDFALEYQRLTKFLNFDLVEPGDINLYINGVGDLTDFSGRAFHLALQAVLDTEIDVFDAVGSYGVVGAQTAIMYETVPNILIALLKMQADLALTQQEGPVDWDLPEDLRPLDPQAILPNANLLGWCRAEELTNEQIGVYGDIGFDLNHFEVRNVDGLPISQNLIKYVSNMLENSKCKATSAMTNSVDGSLSQVPYSVRDIDDINLEPNKNIAAKTMTSVSYTQAGSYIASGAATFRYRIERRQQFINDSVCYRFEGDEPLVAWLNNENSVFNFGAVAIWNLDQFRVSGQNGKGLATMIATKVRRKVVKN